MTKDIELLRVSDERLAELARWARSEEADCLQDNMPVSAGYYADVIRLIESRRSTNMESERPAPAAPPLAVQDGPDRMPHSGVKVSDIVRMIDADTASQAIDAGDGEAVAWQHKLTSIIRYDRPNSYDIAQGDYAPLYARPVPAVTEEMVEAAAKALVIAKGLNADGLHQINVFTGEEHFDYENTRGQRFIFAWRIQVDNARMALTAALSSKEA